MGSLLRRITVALGLAAGVLFFAADASASGCNLYTSGSSCTFNGGVFNVVGPHPTGTGVIDSFLRVQQKGAEEGFNTGARPMTCDTRTCDDKTDPNFTQNLLSSTVPIVNIGGTDYRAFYLDINEPAERSQNYLTLDQVEIYVSNTSQFGHAHLWGSRMGRPDGRHQGVPAWSLRPAERRGRQFREPRLPPGGRGQRLGRHGVVRP